MDHEFEGITNTADLENRLRNWRSFTDRQVYDVGTMFLFLGACLDNLRMHGIQGDFDELSNYLTSEQKEFLYYLGQQAKRQVEVEE